MLADYSLKEKYKTLNIQSDLHVCLSSFFHFFSGIVTSATFGIDTYTLAQANNACIYWPSS